MVSFKRDSISLTNHDSDSIRTTLETRADGITASITNFFSCIISNLDAPSGLLVCLILITTS